MELTITEKKTIPTICLNMIVKDESHIILKTLEMLISKIRFDYWVICDTGSTDNTQEIIKNFFKEKQIPGELIEDKWENFAHNRSLALNYAFEKTDLLLVFDADDEIIGDIQIPSEVNVDGYYLSFGEQIGVVSYKRILLINNRIKWKYESIIHEYIVCLKPEPKMEDLFGNYCIISGKTGNRSKDPKKYLKDALILEDGWKKAKEENDALYLRYAFYCANSYKDYGDYNNAIKWYKIVLTQNNWTQEKYVSCLNLYKCYKIIGQLETGLFYLIESLKYDKERIECIYYLVEHYSMQGLYEVAYNYYLNIKDYYENKYVSLLTIDKLFAENDIYAFLLPYIMIIVCYKISTPNAILTALNMFKIVFIKKYNIDPNSNNNYISNLIYNFQFFIDKQDQNQPQFKELFSLFLEYLYFIQTKGHNLSSSKYSFLYVYEKYGLKIIHQNKFTKEECLQCKNILIYTGYMTKKWNYTYSLNNSLGGSETAAINLALQFPKDYNIYISGTVEEENINNITFISNDKLTKLFENIPFYTVIVSRYLDFYELYQNACFYKSIIWGHDIRLFSYGSNLNANQILEKWNNKIDYCVCQTQWHQDLFLKLYPCLKDKLTNINNGISVEKFTYAPFKILNRFIYTSCAERGLDKLLELWPKISESMPNAELFICSYNDFPRDDFEKGLQTTINSFNNISHLGKLTKDKLYELMSSAEYWLYPTNFEETSCITAMEMLMSEVICIYYPVAGLANTLGGYGIPINKGQEIDILLKLTNKDKNILRKNGKIYAESCSWANRFVSWNNLINLKIGNNNYDSKIVKRMFELYENLSMPEPHLRVLKTIGSHFCPKVIYDIGASTLHWTKEVKKIWNNAEIIAFDAIEEAEELYKSQNIKYYIGVLSDEDNKRVKFYENKENPAGNSYYREIGHPNSINVYPENSYKEKLAKTLKTIVKENNFALPDIIKIDVQGAELDILKGSMDIINNAKYLIIELQSVEYNKGAPLAHITIDFLNNNGWKMIEEKFSDNGPDADYLFVNTNYNQKFTNTDTNTNKKKILFYYDKNFNIISLTDYFDSLKEIYDVSYTSNEDDLITTTNTLVLFITYLLDINIIEKHINKNNTYGLFNTEPLNIPNFLNNCIYLYKHCKLPMFDYSKSNKNILQNNGIKDVQVIEYIPYEKETTYLQNLLNNTDKEYDFGIIGSDRDNNIDLLCWTRKNCVKNLINNGFKVLIISGWKEERDQKLAKCKTILNIHGQCINYEWPKPEHTTKIFEHIRCNRLLAAGFNILSETSLDVDDDFIKKYPNLKFLDYKDILELTPDKWYSIQ